MKPSLKTTLLNTKKSVERFPLTIIISTILAILIIVLIERVDFLTPDEIEKYTRINMTIGIAMLISLDLKLLLEMYSKKSTLNYALYLLGGLIVLSYYFLFLNDFNFVSITRYIGVTIILILGFFFIPRLKDKSYYENYVRKVFSSLLITAVYSGVLVFGLFSIIFTVEQLFDLILDEKLYFYIFVLTAFIFSVALFLSKIPAKGENLAHTDYSRSLRILLLYIVIPLICIYTLILYLYFAKILISSNWPKGLVSHLVLWYSAVSVGVLFLITPLTEKWSVARIFSGFFPKVNIPLLFMMFTSIGIRIKQYGITENRYYVCLLGLWLLLIMIYYSFVKKVQNIIVPISLMVVCIIALFGPLSSYSVSIRSQNKRFEEILNKNEMILNGSIQKNAKIDAKDKHEISNILSYFDNYHGFEEIKLLPEGFDLNDMEDVFGFDYFHLSTIDDEEYFHLYTDMYGKALDISEYDYYIPMSTWIDYKVNIDELSVAFDGEKIQIEYKEKLLLEKNIEDCIGILQSKIIPEKEEINSNIENISFEEETNQIKVKFIINSISGRTSPNLSVDSAEVLLLIKLKN